MQTKPQRIPQLNTSLPIHEGEAPVISAARVSCELCLGSCWLCDNGSVIILTTAVLRSPHLRRTNAHSRNVCRCATTSLNSFKTTVTLHDIEHEFVFKAISSFTRMNRRSQNCIKQPRTYIHTQAITFYWCSFCSFKSKHFDLFGHVLGKCEWADLVMLCLGVQSMSGMERTV